MPCCRTIAAPPANACLCVFFCARKTGTRTQTQRGRVSHVYDLCKMAKTHSRLCSEQLPACTLHWLPSWLKIQQNKAPPHLWTFRSSNLVLCVIHIKTSVNICSFAVSLMCTGSLWVWQQSIWLNEWYWWFSAPQEDLTHSAHRDGDLWSTQLVCMQIFV